MKANKLASHKTLVIYDYLMLISIKLAPCFNPRIPLKPFSLPSANLDSDFHFSFKQ